MIRCRVLDTTAARDAAELVRVGVFSGWSVEWVPTAMGRDLNGLSVVKRAWVFGAALAWSPAYKQSTCWLRGVI